MHPLARLTNSTNLKSFYIWQQLHWFFRQQYLDGDFGSTCTFVKSGHHACPRIRQSPPNTYHYIFLKCASYDLFHGWQFVWKISHIFFFSKTNANINFPPYFSNFTSQHYCDKKNLQFPLFLRIYVTKLLKYWTVNNAWADVIIYHKIFTGTAKK